MQQITYISQDAHYNLHLRYFEKNKDRLVEIPRFGTDKRKNDLYIARLANDIARRKDQIKFINDSFQNHTRYKQINIDGKVVVLENPTALLKRADFANLAVALNDQKRNLQIRKAKLQRKAIKATAIISTAIAVGTFIATATPYMQDMFQANAASETTIEEAQPQLASSQDIESTLTTPNTAPMPSETTSETTETPDSSIDESVQEPAPVTTETELEDSYIQPEPVVIPDEVEVGTGDILDNTYEIPEEDSSYSTDTLEFLGETYGMTEDQLEDIFQNRNIDVNTASFATMQSTVSDIYWSNPSIFTPLEVPASASDVERELYKAAMAYGFTNDDEIATIIAISRLETGNYTSAKFQNLNNLGGVRDSSGNFIQYNTISQGAIGLTKSIAKIKNNMIQNGTYNASQSLATNIGPTFCPSNESVAPWAPTVDNIKKEILSSGELSTIRDTENQPTMQQGVMK